MLTAKLDNLEKKFETLEKDLSLPKVIADREKLKNLSKEHAELSEIIEKYRQYKKIAKEIKEAQEMMKESDDQEIRELAESEYLSLKEEEKRLNQEIEFLLLPRDPNDEKNLFMEIRAGTGGEEAALFAEELFQMYLRYAEKENFKMELIDKNETGLGGLKEVVFTISGKGAYSRFKYESGTHRVQRVPTTESGGRIHTSAVTVAVMPEAEEIDVKLEEKDLRVDTYRSSGPGGQHMQKTSSAVRITHIPTGIVVACQDERSQHQNKAKALRFLKAKIYEAETLKQEQARSENRKIQVGTGDRSEKIRTYNFPQGRVTDHRIGLTLYSLDKIMMGEIDEIINGLAHADKLAKLANIKKDATDLDD